MKLKPYPDYKDSGVEWIGEIPVGWENAKLKFLLNKITDGSHTSVEILSEGLPYVTVTDLDEKKEEIDLDKCKKISKKDFDFLVRNGCKPEIGDILFSQIGTIGLVIPVKKDNNFVMLSSLAILTPSQDIESRWITHFLRSNFIKDQYKTMMAGGAVKRITLDHISNFRVLKPTITEQKSIVSFLDKKTSEIDLTIEKDTRLIELLKEKRTALINHLVTKGLDPTAEMKDSGVEWIGEIPLDWYAQKLKLFVSKIGSGITPKGGSSVYVEEGIALLRSQNIHFDGLRLKDVSYITEEINQTMLNSVVKNNDVLLNITGASIGRCACFENQVERANVNQHVCIIRPEKIYHKFLNYVLMSDLGQDQIFSTQMGSSREGVNFEQIGNFIVTYPPYEQQKDIAGYLDKSTQKIDLTIQKIQQNIGLLEEYKKSLIHHVVTGKVDVREVAV